MKNKILLVMAALLLLALPLGSGCAPKEVEVEVEKEYVEIPMGFICDVSGPYASTTASYLHSLIDFIKWVNETDYIPGVKLRLDWHDDRGSVELATTAYERMIAEKPRAPVLINWESHVQLALKDRLIEDEFPAIASGPPPVIHPPGWIFSIMAEYAHEHASLLWWIKNVDWKQGVNPNWEDRPPRLGIITWDTAYGRAFMSDAFFKYAEEQGFEYVGVEYIPVMPTDTSTQILSLMKKEPDYIDGNYMAFAWAVLLKDAQRLGYLDKARWTMAEVGLDHYLPDLAGDACEGAIGVYPNRTWGVNDFLTEPCPAIELAEKLFKDNVRPPEDRRHGYLHGLLWGLRCVETLKVAIDEYGAEAMIGPDNGKLYYDTLVSAKNVDLMGITTPQNYGDKRWSGSCYINTIRDGKVVPLYLDWIAPPVLEGDAEEGYDGTNP